MKPVLKFIDATVGRWLRHFAFILVRLYYAAFYNVSCSNRHLLQDIDGGLILASHVSRHDGPMITALLYSTKRVRPAVHYTEYHNKAQWFPMMLAGAVPLSSPKDWAPERRAAQKVKALDVLRKIIEAGNFVLLFPAGRIRRQPGEVILPRLSGAYDTLKTLPDCPVLLVHIEGLSKFEQPKYDLFWSFLSIKRGRRHVNVTIERADDLSTDCTVEEFNAELERRYNAANSWALRPDADAIAAKLSEL